MLLHTNKLILVLKVKALILFNRDSVRAKVAKCLFFLDCKSTRFLHQLTFTYCRHILKKHALYRMVFLSIQKKVFDSIIKKWEKIASIDQKKVENWTNMFRYGKQ